MSSFPQSLWRKPGSLFSCSKRLMVPACRVSLKSILLPVKWDDRFMDVMGCSRCLFSFEMNWYCEIWVWCFLFTCSLNWGKTAWLQEMAKNSSSRGSVKRFPKLNRKIFTFTLFFFFFLKSRWWSKTFSFWQKLKEFQHCDWLEPFYVTFKHVILSLAPGTLASSQVDWWF